MKRSKLVLGLSGGLVAVLMIAFVVTAGDGGFFQGNLLGAGRRYVNADPVLIMNTDKQDFQILVSPKKDLFKIELQMFNALTNAAVAVPAASVGDAQRYVHFAEGPFRLHWDWKDANGQAIQSLNDNMGLRLKYKIVVYEYNAASPAVAGRKVEVANGIFDARSSQPVNIGGGQMTLAGQCPAGYPSKTICTVPAGSPCPIGTTGTAPICVPLAGPSGMQGPGMGMGGMGINNGSNQ